MPFGEGKLFVCSKDAYRRETARREGRGLEEGEEDVNVLSVPKYPAKLFAWERDRRETKMAKRRKKLRGIRSKLDSSAAGRAREEGEEEGEFRTFDDPANEEGVPAFEDDPEMYEINDPGLEDFIENGLADPASFKSKKKRKVFLKGERQETAWAQFMVLDGWRGLRGLDFVKGLSERQKKLLPVMSAFNKRERIKRFAAVTETSKQNTLLRNDWLMQREADGQTERVCENLTPEELDVRVKELAEEDRVLASALGVAYTDETEDVDNELTSYDPAIVSHMSYGRKLQTMFRKPFRVFSMVHAGQGQMIFGPSGKSFSDLTLCFSRHGGLPGMIYVANYHGGYWHYNNHTSSCSVNSDGSHYPLELKTTTMSDDYFKCRLAEALSRVEPKNLVFQYDFHFECDYHHGETFCGSLPGRGKDSLRSFLRAEHPDEVILPPRGNSDHISQPDLVEKICSGDPDFGGFVTVVGGREETPSGDTPEATKLVLDQFGFCPQKCEIEASELSPFTKRQILNALGATEGADDAADEFTEAEEGVVCNFMKKQTLKTHARNGVKRSMTLTVSFFRWLIQHRGLKGFFISHYVQFSEKKWWRDYLVPLMHKRDRFKKEGNASAQMCCKLILNSHYGIQSYLKTNYSTTHLISESSLARTSVYSTVLKRASDVSPVGLVKAAKIFNPDEEEEDEEAGVEADAALFEEEEEEEMEDGGCDDDELFLRDLETREQRDEEDAPKYQYQVLYAVTVPNTDCSISNSLPTAAAILSNSKEMFLSKIHALLMAADPAALEVVYTDTGEPSKLF